MAVPLAGAKVRASDLATIFPTNTDAWTSYTPAWTGSTTNPVIGNGTLTGLYNKVGRRVDYYVVLVAGSTTTFGSGLYSISLPVATAQAGGTPLGRAAIVDSSAGTRFMRDAIINTSTTVVFTSEAGATVTNLVPMTWAVSDTLIITGSFLSTS